MASNKNYMLNDKFPKHIKNATSTSDGMMSSQDKSRLDNLFEFGLLSPATEDKDGIMTKEDKIKLDSLENYEYIHPDDENTRHVTDKQIEKWDTQTYYTNNKPTDIAVGGIEKGSTFDKVDYNVLFTRLLYPYIEPSISNISMMPSTRIMEKGQIAMLNRYYFKINAPSTNGMMHYDFKVDNNIIKTLDTESRTIDVIVSHSFNTDCTASVVVTDIENDREKSFNLIDYKFVYPMYYGIVSKYQTIDSALITTKTKILETKGTKSFNISTDNQRILFAYPKSYGLLSAIYDANNFNILNTFTVNTMIINTLDGLDTEYYVYSNEVSTVTDYNIKFTF